MIVSKKAILGLIDNLDDGLGIQVSDNIYIKKEPSNYGGLATVPIDKKDLKKFIKNLDGEKLLMHYCRELTIKSIESSNADKLDEMEKKLTAVQQDYTKLSGEVDFYKEVIETLQRETYGFTKMAISSWIHKIIKLLKRFYKKIMVRT